MRVINIIFDIKNPEQSGFFIVCRACRLTRRCESVMGDCSFKPLAKSKGVYREAESEESLRQSSDLRNANIIRHIRSDELVRQNEVPKLHEERSVNDAGIWNESKSSYHGRFHRQAETK
jgi:hypothetical protein